MSPEEAALKASIQQRIKRLQPTIANMGTELSVTIRDRNFRLKFQSIASSGTSEIG